MFAVDIGRLTFIISVQALASAAPDEHDTNFTALLAATTVVHGCPPAVEMLRDLGFDEQAAAAVSTASAPEKMKLIQQDVAALLKA